jgi:histone-lysine N-methyltransferase SETD1
MSRASDPPGFAAYFPSAPRAAKDKAKEREKVKSQKLDSPTIRAVVDGRSSFLNNRLENIPPSRSGGEKSILVTDTSAAQADDTESLQGDLLNGVGSASSHASSVSTVFSIPAPQTGISTNGGSRNMSSLTPLTNIESSPNRMPSPQQQHKNDVPASDLSQINEQAVTANDVLHTQSAPADQSTPASRVFARDPNKSVKGEVCTYDPNDKKKAKPIYKEFGLVRIIQSVGSVILLV